MRYLAVDHVVSNHPIGRLGAAARVGRLTVRGLCGVAAQAWSGGFLCSPGRWRATGPDGQGRAFAPHGINGFHCHAMSN